MDEKINVLNKYTVHIGTDSFKNLSKIVAFSKYSKVFLIADKQLSQSWEKVFPKEALTIVIPSGEQSKNLETVENIWEVLLKSKADRKSLVVNIGGGVVTDLGGFAASTYMRGLDFINVPTTLLSMVDASVGGKTGIDFGGVKNLIGTFSQPIAVVCDIQFLETLPDREFISGFGEIVKHGLIADEKYFQFVISKKPREFTQEELVQIITKSIQIKKEIVAADEKESGSRKLLNFGHTIGHAIEALSLETSYSFLHGEAVSIGVMAETKLSQLVGNISISDVQKIKESLLKLGLPISFSNISTDRILEKIQHDKKSEGNNINFTLLENIGKGAINQNVSDKAINKALEFTTS